MLVRLSIIPLYAEGVDAGQGWMVRVIVLHKGISEGVCHIFAQLYSGERDR
jgi:hypothetical protein